MNDDRSVTSTLGTAFTWGCGIASGALVALFGFFLLMAFCNSLAEPRRSADPLPPPPLSKHWTPEERKAARKAAEDYAEELVRRIRGAAKDGKSPKD